MTDILTIGGGIVLVISVAFNAIQAFSEGFSKTEKAKDKASSELVELLQKTVNALKDELGELQKAHLDNVKEISRLSGENQTLTKILQGRDEATVRFQQQGMSAFLLIEKQGEFFKTHGAFLERLTSTLDRIDAHLTAAE